MEGTKNVTFRPKNIADDYRRGQAAAMFKVMTSLQGITSDLETGLDEDYPPEFLDGVGTLAERLKETLFTALEHLGSEVFEVKPK